MPEKPKLLNLPNENAFDAEISEAAAAAGIPAHLGKALVAAESQFDPKAWRAEPHLDKKDAGGAVILVEGSRGLTQILFATAAGNGYKGKPEGLFDVRTNLAAGFGHLARLLRAPSYNVPDAVAAYNMGSPRKAAQTTGWIRKIYGDPVIEGPDAWIYANEPYVRKILLLAAGYEAAARGDSAAAAQVRELLKKKPRPSVISIWSWTRVSTSDRPLLISGRFDWPRLPGVA